MALLAHPSRPSSRRRALLAVVVGVLVLALGAVAGAVLPVLWPAHSSTATFAPDAEDGLLVDPASAHDDAHPAITRLDPALRDAVRAAEGAAAQDGVLLRITSGWRSVAYQEWLFDDAVRLYASEEIARQFVALPERSSHVTGAAVDISGLDAQLWLSARGFEFGLCQTYANERWHFELATTPGGECPLMRTDAGG